MCEHVTVKHFFFSFLYLQGLSTLQETGDDLLDYQPHLYGDEGDADNLSDLDNISIPGDESYEKTIEDLGPRFTKLASICKPPQTQNWTHAI